MNTARRRASRSSREGPKRSFAASLGALDGCAALYMYIYIHIYIYTYVHTYFYCKRFALPASAQPSFRLAYLETSLRLRRRGWTCWMTWGQTRYIYIYMPYINIYIYIYATPPGHIYIYIHMCIYTCITTTSCCELRQAEGPRRAARAPRTEGLPPGVLSEGTSLSSFRFGVAPKTVRATHRWGVRCCFCSMDVFFVPLLFLCAPCTFGKPRGSEPQIPTCPPFWW